MSVLVVGLLAALTVGASSSGAGSRKLAPPKWVLHGPYNPSIKPADFVATIDNRYFPLAPGTTFHFRDTATRLRRRTTSS
jgi:hypothetical protein